MKLSVHNFVELSRCLKTIQNELGKDPYLGDSVPQPRHGGVGRRCHRPFRLSNAASRWRENPLLASLQPFGGSQPSERGQQQRTRHVQRRGCAGTGESVFPAPSAHIFAQPVHHCCYCYCCCCYYSFCYCDLRCHCCYQFCLCEC